MTKWSLFQEFETCSIMGGGCAGVVLYHVINQKKTHMYAEKASDKIQYIFLIKNSQKTECN